MRRPHRDAHVVIHDGTGRYPAWTVQCRVCRAVLKTPLPMSLTVFLAMAKAYQREHRACAATVAATTARA